MRRPPPLRVARPPPGPLPGPISPAVQSAKQRQICNRLGVATRPPAASFPARLQAGRSRRLPPIPDAPTGTRALTRGACRRTPYRSGTGPPHGVERRYHPARVWQALTVGASCGYLLAAARHPDRYGHRRAFTAEASIAAIAQARQSQAPLRALRVRRHFHIPSAAAAATGTPARGPPAPRRKGQRQKALTIAGAAPPFPPARTAARIRASYRLPRHAPMRGTPAAALGRGFPPRTLPRGIGTIHRRCRHSEPRPADGQPRRTRSRQAFGYSARRGYAALSCPLPTGRPAAGGWPVSQARRAGRWPRYPAAGLALTRLCGNLSFVNGWPDSLHLIPTSGEDEVSKVRAAL